VAASTGAAPPPEPEVDYSKSEMERALIAGGLDPNAAADVKRRSDELSMAKMYLRDQASREEWLDTPRFQEEMAALDAQQVSFRNELGDDGYDRFLFSLGQTNRVRVDDVMSGSPAADAGFEVGDMILRYGDTRVFAPDELVAQTQAGQPGETVPVTVIRQGKLLTVEVPRGPLGLRIAATQSNPQSG
jgi:C-terminal processing protease CtpA/Prc